MTHPNEPAFPVDEKWTGFTKREAIAKAAMEGFLANPNVLNATNQAGGNLTVSLSLMSVEFADALIAALNREVV